MPGCGSDTDGRRQKYVEQQAEGIDVICLRRRQSEQLRGASVLRRHHAVDRGLT